MKSRKMISYCMCVMTTPKPHFQLSIFSKAFQRDVQAACARCLHRLRYVSLHSCRLPDLSHLKLWNVSRDVTALSSSSIDVPAKLLHHLKITLLGFPSQLTDTLNSQKPLIRNIWLACKVGDSRKTTVVNKHNQSITNNVLK